MFVWKPELIGRRPPRPKNIFIAQGVKSSRVSTPWVGSSISLYVEAVMKKYHIHNSGAELIRCFYGITNYPPFCFGLFFCLFVLVIFADTSL